MGQRFQIFVNIHNPLNNEEVVKDLKGFDSEGKQLNHAKVIFGEKKTSMLAFHNQWLFGMSAAATCANIMREVYKSKNPVHILSKELEGLPYPKDYTGDKDKVDGYFELIESLFFNLFDVDFASHGSRYGLERVANLVDECYDRKTGKFDSKYDIRKDFRRGDNNDGIMIVDAVNKKYCFMNIFEDRDEDEKYNVYRLKPLTPSTAGEYVAAYYPTGKLDDYDLEKCKGDEEKVQKLLKEHQRKVSFVNKVFSKYELLSLDEIKKMFPAVYRIKKVKETK